MKPIFGVKMYGEKKKIDINQGIFLEEKPAKINTITQMSNESDLPWDRYLGGHTALLPAVLRRSGVVDAPTQEKRGPIHNGMDVCTSV